MTSSEYRHDYPMMDRRDRLVEEYEARAAVCADIQRARRTQEARGEAARERVMQAIREARYMRALHALRVAEGADLNDWKYRRDAAYYVHEYAPLTEAEEETLRPYWPLTLYDKSLLNWTK